MMTSLFNAPRPLVRGALLTAALLAAWCGRGVCQDAVESGRQSLGKRGRVPWYDPQEDAIRRIDVRPDKDSAPANRNSDWRKETKQKQTGPTNTGRRSSPFLIALMSILLVMVLAGLVALVIWSLLRGEGRRATQSESWPAEASRDIDRIENLPFRVNKPQSDLLAEARRQYEAGNFDQAVIYLYSYQLVELDKHQRIRLTRGKTNRQYLREIRSQPPLSQLLENTMIAFEEVFFGHHSLQRRQFESCWQRLDEFQQLLPGGV